MEFREYVAPIRRWWWLILASVLIASGSAFIASGQLAPAYVARTTLLVGKAIYSLNPNSNDFGLSQTLAKAYSVVAMREPIAQATTAQLGLKQMPDYSAQASADGQFLEITVTDSNPERARDVANELARQLIAQSPSGATNSNVDTERQQFIAQQLDELQQKITQTKTDISTKQASLGDLTSASEIDSTQNDIAGLETRLTALQNNYSSLLANTIQGAANTLSVFEPAGLPTNPVGPSKSLIVLVAALSGLVLSTGAAYLIELLDDTLKTVQEVSRLVPYPILGLIGEIGRSHTGFLSVADLPRSPLAEAFRSLRTNLEFASVDKGLKTIFVTSPAAADGKSLIAFNLALIMAQSGKRVVLLDADMRKPSLHRILGIPNADGLSDLFRGHLQLVDVTRPWRSEQLMVITSGTLPPNPSELLASHRMDQILAELKTTADVVIVDGPPFFISDAWVIASKVDGVLLVMQPGYTRRHVTRAMLEQIKRVNAPIIGTIVNRVARSVSAYQRYSYLASSYDYGPEKAGALTAGSRQRGLQALIGGWRGPRPAAAPEVAAPNGHAPGPTAPEMAAPGPAETPEAERERVSLDLLYAISRELATSADERDVMRRVLQLTLNGIGATSGSLIRLNERGQALDGVKVYQGQTSLETAEQLADVVQHGLAGWVIEHRRPALLHSTHNDPRWLQRIWSDDASDNDSDQPRSAISVPLMANSRVVGVLTLAHPNEGHFTRDDLSMLTAIAVGISFNSQPNAG